MKCRVTRDDIVRTTQELIIRNGIRAVRVDEIAQVLGISKRTLYELFSDKDALIQQCWNRIREQQQQRVADYLQYRPGTALEQAGNLVEEYIASLWLVSSVSLQELQHRVSYTPIFEKNKQFWRTSFIGALKHCVADEDLLPEANNGLFADGMMNLLFNLYLEGTTRREMETFGWVLLRGLATHKGIERLDKNRPNA